MARQTGYRCWSSPATPVPGQGQDPADPRDRRRAGRQPAPGDAVANRRHRRRLRRRAGRALVHPGHNPSLSRGSPNEQFGLELHVQSGEDLGERMHRALQSRLDDASGALLVGTDCPFLEAGDLRTAAGVLQEGADAVIGPAADGGYYLIGVRQSVAEIYAGVPWGSHQVLARSRENLRELGWSWHELVPRRDVDRPEDLSAVEDILVY